MNCKEVVVNYHFRDILPERSFEVGRSRFPKIYMLAYLHRNSLAWPPSCRLLCFFLRGKRTCCCAIASLVPVVILTRQKQISNLKFSIPWVFSHYFRRYFDERVSLVEFCYTSMASVLLDNMKLPANVFTLKAIYNSRFAKHCCT